LLPVAEEFQKSWIIPYNLACYCWQLRQSEEAKEWFKKAMAVDEHIVKREAIDDHDLKPLWNSMRWMLWKPSEQASFLGRLMALSHGKRGLPAARRQIAPVRLHHRKKLMASKCHSIRHARTAADVPEPPCSAFRVHDTTPARCESTHSHKLTAPNKTALPSQLPPTATCRG